MNIYDIESNYGKLIIGNRHSKPTLGLQAFAAYFYEVSECVYVTNEKEFYIYNSKSGLWERQPKEVLISRISEVMLDLAQAEEIDDEFTSMRRPAVIRDVIVYLSALASVSEDFFDKHGNWIHCLNGVIEFESDSWILKPFSPGNICSARLLG